MYVAQERQKPHYTQEGVITKKKHAKWGAMALKAVYHVGTVGETAIIYYCRLRVSREDIILEKGAVIVTIATITTIVIMAQSVSTLFQRYDMYCIRCAVTSSSEPRTFFRWRAGENRTLAYR